MKIYTPSPNYMKQKSIITCYSNQEQIHDQYKDEDDITINNNNTLNHCNDISIYTTQGFNDIDLKCNDDSSLCDISGSIYCTHLNDECSSLIFNNINHKYQCENNDEFCMSLSPSISPTLSSVGINEIDEMDEINGMNGIPSSRPTDHRPNPTVVGLF